MSPKIPIAPTATFANIAKNHYAYLLITVVSILWYLLYFVLSGVSTNDKNCQKEKEQLRSDLILERKKTDDLINSILINKGVISRLSELVDTTKLNKNEDK